MHAIIILTSIAGALYLWLAKRRQDRLRIAQMRRAFAMINPHWTAAQVQDEVDLYTGRGRYDPKRYG
jgi:hypothetical protein